MKKILQNSIGPYRILPFRIKVHSWTHCINQYFFNQAMINPAYTGVNDIFNLLPLVEHNGWELMGHQLPIP